MPKNSSSALTDRYGLITDYLAEAFHHQLKHSNRYEEVSKRVRLGRAVEGRDEKGIKKTLCAFLKILHPVDQPSDEEFEEYVAYAVECRRRVKEQMNKRKPDDEFGKIDLSYIGVDGKEVVIYCPESRSAAATLSPARSRLRANGGEREEAPDDPPVAQPVETGSTPAAEAVPAAPPSPLPLTERHYTIQYGDTGHTYDGIFGLYLGGAKAVTIEDPYIRAQHQIINFVRFCETVVKFAPSVRRLHLITGYDEKTDLAAVNEKLEELKQSLLEVDVSLDIEMKNKLHDREVRIDNGWTVKIGRGLDFYQRPESWFAVGANDLSLRKCLETKVDIFKAS
jgi:ATP-dependent Lon protease